MVFRDVNTYLLPRSCCEHRVPPARTLYDRSPRYHATPNGNQTNHHTSHNVKQPQPNLPILQRSQRLKLEAGKSCIPSNKTNWNQVSPVDAPMGSHRQQRKNQADQKRTCDINDKCSVGKTSSHFAADVSSQPEAQNRPQTASDANHHVFQQAARLLSLYHHARQVAQPEFSPASFGYQFCGSLPVP